MDVPPALDVPRVDGSTTCTSLANIATPVLDRVLTGALPDAVGGTIQDGLYVLTNHDYYQPTSPLRLRQTTLLVRGSTVELVVHDQDSAESRATADVTTSAGATFRMVTRCPGTMMADLDRYSVTSTGFLLFSTAQRKVITFTRAGVTPADAGTPDAGADAGSTDAPTGVDVPGTRFAAASLGLGLEYSCARRADGSAWCWGTGTSGQLGTGALLNVLTPTRVVGADGTGSLASVRQIVGSYANTTCALLEDRSVSCWGRIAGAGGKTPTRSLTPTPVAGLTGIEQLAANTDLVCARRNDGAALCFGNNGSGELGDGTTTTRTTPAEVRNTAGSGSLANVAEIAVGAQFACARLTSGGVVCWGGNRNGELGDGSTATQRLLPGPVSGITNAIAIAAGHHHACALLMDRTLRCWGINGSGQLGDGSTTTRRTPVAVTGIADVAQVTIEGDSFNDARTCARRMDGAAFCWGANNQGQLGDGTMTSHSTPTAVLGPGGAGTLTGVTEIAAGGLHTCAILGGGGGLWCWGRNNAGQLGDGSTTRRLFPVPVIAAP